MLYKTNFNGTIAKSYRAGGFCIRATKIFLRGFVPTIGTFFYEYFMSYYIEHQQIEEARNAINDAKVTKTEKQTSLKEFANFLSQKRNNVACAIKPYWITKCKKISNGQDVAGLKKEQANDIIAAIGRAYAEYGIKKNLPSLASLKPSTEAA